MTLVFDATNVNSPDSGNPTMLKIKRIRALLADRNLAAVARKTSLHVNTVRAIASGLNKNPLPETIKKLSKYLSVR